MHWEDSQPGRGHALANRAHGRQDKIRWHLADWKRPTPVRESTLMIQGYHQPVNHALSFTKPSWWNGGQWLTLAQAVRNKHRHSGV